MDAAELERYIAERFDCVQTTRKAYNLLGDEELADGARILRLSFQLNWVYAQIVKDGCLRTRRYRHHQDVKIVKLVPKTP